MRFDDVAEDTMIDLEDREYFYYDDRDLNEHRFDINADSTKKNGYVSVTACTREPLTSNQDSEFYSSINDLGMTGIEVVNSLNINNANRIGVAVAVDSDYTLEDLDDAGIFGILLDYLS